MRKWSKPMWLVVVVLSSILLVGASAEPAVEDKEELPVENKRGVRSEHYRRGDMHPDRPELSVSAYTVAPGTVQLESELELEREVEATETRVALPQLLRIGIVQGLELRMESDLLVFEGDKRGISDVTLGMKWNILDEGPTLGVLADFTIPAGQEGLRSEGPDANFRLLSDIPLSDSWEMRLNLGATSVLEDEDRNLEVVFGAVVYYDLSEKWEAHLEYGRQGTERGGRGRPIQVLDTGLVYRVDENTHVDITYYKGLNNREGLDWKLGLGFARRF